MLDDYVDRIQRALSKKLLGDGRGAGKLYEPDETLTIEKLLKTKREFDAKYSDPIPVAVVVRPEYYQTISSTVCKSVEWPDGLNHFPGLPVYSDERQKEPWNFFYDWNKLRKYLS